MEPVALNLLGLSIRWYGIFVAAGFLLAVVNWNWLDRRAGFAKGFGFDFGVVVMAGGIVGSRLAHVLGEWPRYAAHPASILRIDAGGMTYYGGLIVGFAAGVVLARLRKIPVLALADYGVPGLVLGHGIGRIGCYVNGCCYGMATSSPLGVAAAGVHRLPVQLFEAVFNVGLCLFLNYCFVRRGPKPGRILALYCGLYGLWRFGLEFLRADDRVFFAGLSAAQWVSLALMSLAAGLWRVTRSKAAA